MNQYLELLKTIKEKGTQKPPARAGMPGSLSLFGYQYRHDLADGFPLLTTKKIGFKTVVTELLWFLRGDTNIKYLIDNGCNIWNEDAYNYYVKLCKQWNELGVDFQDFVELVKKGETHPTYKFYTFGDCGLQYGYQWRSFGGLAKYQVQPKPKREQSWKGSSKHSLKHTWEQMHERCYNINAVGFKNYGAKGVYVCDDWFDFGAFADSVTTLEGWEEKEANWEGWQLDKDFVGDGFCYSPGTCRWVSRETNMSSSIEKFTFFREEDNYKETTNNLRKFGRKYNLSHANLSRVISGQRKSTGGFILEKIESKYDGKDQIKELIEGLKNSPQGRRHIVTAWNPKDLENLALHPCHALFQFNCRPLTRLQRAEWLEKTYHETIRGKEELIDVYYDTRNVPKYYLDCHLYQRSADVVLGVPFNIASYSLLIHILAKICNMVPGEFIHSFGDVHCYDTHTEQIEEQLTRKPLPLPTLKINWAINVDFGLVMNGHLDDFINSLKSEMFVLENYNSHPPIKAKLSTGLK